ncbi:MAG: M48 family metalloprotease, partial [Woeseiaceae bacterium]
AISPQAQRPTDVTIQGYLQRSYLELFEIAPELNVTASDAKQIEKWLKDARKICVGRFEKSEDTADDALKKARKRLREDTGTLSDEERQSRHCSIEHLRAQQERARVLADHAIPLAYDNQLAKLKLLVEWPADLEEIRASIRAGTYHDREYGDVQDIGIRGVGEGQEKDVRIGQEAVEQMKQSGVMPDPVDNEIIQTYVQQLTERIATHSDLRVPVQVEVLDAPEVNAFALPGGFLFVQRGLLEAAEDEVQLVGVLSHEIAHAAARHGNRMMGRARWSNLFYQAAQIGALVLTGGASSIGTYYATQYGLMGLGMVLSLDMLGVSRDFELEADQLGVQYAWNAGYDPSGFIRFFDKMATTKGYVDGTSFFRTHPPFYERMVKAKREIMYLPNKDNPTTHGDGFLEMKAELAKVLEIAEEEEEHRPSLRDPVASCGEPEGSSDGASDQPIELLCASTS